MFDKIDDTRIKTINFKPDRESAPSTGICHKFYTLIILKYKNKNIIQ